MKKTEAINLFGGSVRKAADSLGISTQAVHQWPEDLGQTLISKIITTLMKEKRSKEAGEIIKRYLK